GRATLGGGLSNISLSPPPSPGVARRRQPRAMVQNTFGVRKANCDTTSTLLPLASRLAFEHCSLHADNGDEAGSVRLMIRWILLAVIALVGVGVVIGAVGLTWAHVA